MTYSNYCLVKINIVKNNSLIEKKIASFVFQLLMFIKTTSVRLAGVIFEHFFFF